MIYRIREVMKETGLSKSSVFSFVKTGRFPQPIRLSPRCVGWEEAQIKSWLSERKAQGYQALPYPRKAAPQPQQASA